MKRLKSIQKVTIGFFSLLLIMGSAQAAPYQNRHDYNGSYCNPLEPADAVHFSRTNAGITNNSLNYKYISCPVLVDENKVTTGTFTTWIHYTGTGKVECWIHSINSNGSTIQTMSRWRNNSGWLPISGLTNEVRWGSYNISCGVPAGGTINMIAVNEKAQ